MEHATQQASKCSELGAEQTRVETKIGDIKQHITDLEHMLARLRREKEAEEARLKEINAQLFAAANQVFSTVELLENILLFTPMTTVVRALRSNSSFKATIMSSPRLRQHIFLDAKPTTKVLAWDLSGRYTLSNFRVSHSPRDLADWPSESSAAFVSLHPFLKPADRSGQSCGAIELVGEPNGILPFSCSGTWRDMQVTNPPCQKVTIGMRLEIKSEEGIKLGRLHDELKAFAASSEYRLSSSIRCAVTLEDVILNIPKWVQQRMDKARLDAVEDRGGSDESE